MLTQRLENYKKLETLRNSKLLVYVTSDRQNAETNIASDIIAPFVNHLDIIKKSDKISLFIYSTGGNILSAWNLVNLIRSYCKDFEIIVPFKCQSAATLIGLGTNRIVMTKQATLGPIDPSTNGHMNPEININGQNIKIPISVEHVNGYLDMAKNDLKITDQKELKDIYLKLTEYIHPLSLGDVFKSKAQIKMLAEKLLKLHEIEAENVTKVVDFLCSGSGSHDYTINRKEAKEELGLNIEKPNDELYQVIKEIYLDIEDEFQLRNPYLPHFLLNDQNPTQYSLRRAIIESIDGGTDVFLSEGVLSINASNHLLNDNRTFEGWKHETITN
ncbi:hypothetical protein J3D55_003761 [Chryseobacterium ginsenosidimutans]|uniref:SDH family Clp fold serine proteinase n=1 Tax=Chryseobacterium ginsenosidimutans TaxID=687846 RepID=UPI00216A6B6C|nr:serine protease [Chryseobacterium ginsenosidimutans]MCS3870845.1 hypothetical protein [Chryseobacterium ginsenosidimutans]